MEEKANVLDRIRSGLSDMHAAEKKVAAFLLERPNEAVLMNISELAAASGVSDATVVRMCKRVGFRGYYQMKIYLSRDLGRDGPFRWGSGTTAESVLEASVHNLNKMMAALDQETLQKVVDLILRAGTVHLIAAGNTIPTAADLSFRLGLCNIATNFSFISDYMVHNMTRAGESDLIIAFSQSGISRRVLRDVAFGKRQGAKVVAITCMQHSPLTDLADYVILTHYDKELLSLDGASSHLLEMCINDLLVYHILHSAPSRKVLVTDRESWETPFDSCDAVELLLSEDKL